MEMKREHKPCEVKSGGTLYKIGMFAAMNHLTVKTLRFYEEQGLLRPALIHPETGYRYYTLSQMAVLHRITALKLAGFTLEEMLRPGAHPCCEATRSLLALLDVLVDGRFVEELRDISLRFRGSRNQRIIDLAATRAQGKLVLWSDGAGERGRLT